MEFKFQKNKMILLPSLNSNPVSSVSSHSYRHPQEVILAQFSLYVHIGGLINPIHFISVALNISVGGSIMTPLYFELILQRVGLNSGCNGIYKVTINSVKLNSLDLHCWLIQ